MHIIDILSLCIIDIYLFLNIMLDFNVINTNKVLYLLAKHINYKTQIKIDSK